MSSPKYTPWLFFFGLLVNLSGLLAFAKGFFPQKVLVPGVNSFESIALDANSSTYWQLATQYKANSDKFDKLVFVVVDALRSDFVFSSNSSMSNLHGLLNSNDAIGFTAFSNPPTVTLPRLKGITTGSTSSFVDAILNIDEDDSSSSSLIGQDSWVTQFLRSNASINFFGDDTWLKLFPQVFKQCEGTSSFFVSDFTEVDNNVTRHIDPQLSNDSFWDVLILHYLGLDHIGHKNGPNSIFMPAKQIEIDGIVSHIYNDYVVSKHNEGEKVLMVVLGDHGMNEIGNHGGSSLGETSAALTFLSPEFKKNNYQQIHNEESVPIYVNENYQFLSSVNQIDLVPTICDFFNLPLPKNNLGVLLKKFIMKTDSNGRLDYPQIFFKLLTNAYQFRHLVELKFGKALPNVIGDFDASGSEFDLLCYLWCQSVLKLELVFPNDPKFSNTPDHDLDEIIDAFFDFLKETQDHLQNSATNYDVPLLMRSIAAVSIATLFLCSIAYFEFKSFSGSFLFMVFVIIMAISTFGSSTIEEEHQLWFFFASLFFVILNLGLPKTHSFKQKLLYVLFSLLFLRAIRFWNASGQKFNFLTEFVDLKLVYHLTNSYKNVALSIMFVTIFLHTQMLANGGFQLIHNSLSFVIPFTSSLLIASFKVNFDFINTGGKSFNSFFTKIVDKTSSMIVQDSGDSKELLISLAQISFIMLGSMLLLRITLRFVKLLWLNTVIKQKQTKVVKRLNIDDETAIKTQLIRNQAKKRNQKMFNQMEKKSVVKSTIVDGRYKLLPDIVNIINLGLIMQTKLENIGLYFVFFLLREVSLKFFNGLIKNELARVAENSEPLQFDENQAEEEKEFLEELKNKALLIKNNYHKKIAFIMAIENLLLQNLCFFQFGFTNSLSTVDLANAYNGTRSYNLILIGVLTFVSNFTSPIYWSFNSLLWLYDNDLVNNDPATHLPGTSSVIMRNSSAVKWEVFYTKILVQTVFYAVYGLALCVACYSLRYHLFIWTVFSPKLLFFGVWALLMNFVLELVVALVISIL